MNATLKTLCLLIALVCLQLGCSTSARRSPQAAATLWRPIPPKRGQPIDVLGLTCYLEFESTNLLRQGKISAPLLPKKALQTCDLKLVPQPSATLTPAEMSESVEMGVAVLGQITGTSNAAHLSNMGTGFFLTESGALATCLHVITESKGLGFTVLTRDGRVCPVRGVLAVDVTNDIVILQVEGQGFTPLSVAPSVRQGEPLWVLSHPEGRYYTLTAGIASGYFTYASTLGQFTVLNITADFARGSSGAPVLDERGAVVGIAKFTQAIYGASEGPDHYAQMATKSCTPSSFLLNLIKPE